MSNVMLLGSCATLQEEFWFHVSAQDELPLAMPRERVEVESTLNEFLHSYGEHRGDLIALVAAKLLQSPSLVDELRALVSISDKRLYLDLSYIFSRTIFNASTLCGCVPSGLVRHQTSFFRNLLRRADRKEAAATAIADYLLGKGLKEILDVYAGLDGVQRSAIVKSLISPREVQQQEAKLRGHGPEASLARLLHGLGVALVPADKAMNPMAEHDPNVSYRQIEIVPRAREETFSCDMVVVDQAGLPLICIVSLVHSSDPGQFGVDKAATVAYIKRAVDVSNDSSGRKVELWGVLDGVGYSENKNGTINAMLPHLDCLIQMNSLWKAALRAHQLGLTKVKAIWFDDTWYGPSHVEQLKKYVPDGVEVVSSSAPEESRIDAGKAGIWLG